ncbi:MAG: PEP-CTERM sorting domain-containing protein [Halochromatium sp.]
MTFSIQALDTVSAVPAPATVALFAIGLVGLGIARQRARLVGKPSSAA